MRALIEWRGRVFTVVENSVSSCEACPLKDSSECGEINKDFKRNRHRFLKDSSLCLALANLNGIRNNYSLKELENE